MKKTLSQKIIQILIYSLYPLLLLVLFVILNTYIFLGEIKTNVDTANNLYESFFGFSLPLILSLVVIPFVIEYYAKGSTLESLGLKYKKKKSNYIWSLLLILLSICISIYLIEIDISYSVVIISFIFVGICEEFYCRGILYKIIEEEFNSVTSIVLNSIIFSFIYHSGGSIYANLFFRLPIALILSLSRYYKKSLYDAIIIHYIYNITIIFI